MFDASSRPQVRRREREARQVAKDNTTILTAIMDDYGGRRWMYEKFSRARLFTTCFSNDALQMAFNCGIQNEALQDFQEVVTKCPNQYIQMMREAHERQLAADTNSRVNRVDSARRDGDIREAERIGLLAERTAEGDEFDPFEGDGDSEGADEGR